MLTQRKKIQNAIHFVKDEYGIFFGILFLLSAVGSAFFLQGLPFRVLSTQAQIASNSPQNEVLAVEQAQPSTRLAVGQTGVEIPKLAVAAPLSIVSSADPKDFIEPLNNGVAHFPSALPGEPGTATILGHSAPPGWPNIKYDNIFSNIDALQAGDIIIVRYEGKDFQYIVTSQEIVRANQETPIIKDSKPRLQLISCWPPGIDHQRIVVSAELKLD